MADRTAIEWMDATWNPITGCSVHSPGCLGHDFEHQSDGTTLLRMKKSDAGRLLDGVEHNGFPGTRA